MASADKDNVNSGSAIWDEYCIRKDTSFQAPECPHGHASKYVILARGVLLQRVLAEILTIDFLRQRFTTIVVPALHTKN
jgi:hypothetical protein